ncbi:sulfatase, partial [candidate division KSB1 bacterium]
MAKDNFNRREFIKAVGLSAASSALPFSAGCMDGQNVKSGKPNVLFIAVDDLRPQINCYGHSQMISPNIDALASSGTVFSRCYCQVPVCGASRASLLTGTRPTRSRFVTHYASADREIPGATVLPRYFKNNGYYTISNGKIFHHRKDSIEGWSEKPWFPEGVWLNYLKKENIDMVNNNGSRRGPAYESADAPDNAYFDGKIADKAISDLRRLNKMDKPFFLAVGFVKPHLPFNAPKKYWDLYDREKIDLADNPFRPKGAPDAALHNWGELRQYAGIPGKGPLSDEMARTLVHGYYACVSYTDAQIGLVIGELDRLGLRDNTIIVLWGDHGWQLGEHGMWCKHCNFETSLHSPLIVSARYFKGGQKTNALTEFVDIYPSLCDLCGLQLPGHLQGNSFVPLLRKPNKKWKKAVFSRYRDGDSVRTDRYRYTEYTNDKGQVYARMLYDHQLDPMENVNISELPENRELVERLRKVL